MNDAPLKDASLVFRVDAVLCAIPLEHVIETMRPLPAEPLAGVPPFVRGLAIIRGLPVPVVDAALLMGGGDTSQTRYVILRMGARRVALSVLEVVGIRAIAPRTLESLPPLLHSAAAETIGFIGSLDNELLLVLQSARLVPDSVWKIAEAGQNVS